MFPIAIIVAVTAVAAFLADVFRKPHRCIYLYLLVRFLFPKTWELELSPGQEPVLLWRAAETVQFCLLMLVVATKWRSIVPRLNAFPVIRNFFLVFAATVGISTFFPLFLEVTGIRGRGFDVSLLREVFLATHYLFAIGVFLAAIMFLDTVPKVMGLLRCLVACGVVGLVDVFVFYLLDLSPAIRDATTGTSGGFGGLAMGSPDALGRISVFAVFAAFGLARLTGSESYYLLGISFFLPVLVAASRPVLISLLLGLVVYAYLTRNVKKGVEERRSTVPLLRAAVVIICLFLPLGIGAFQAQGAIENWVQDATQREDFFSPDVGVLSRLAIWYRAVDVAIETFPIGAGGGMLPYYMTPAKGSTVGSHADAILPGFATNFMEHMYDRTFTELTSVHNTYLEFMVENGLGGMILCGWFGWLTLRAYKRLRNRQHPLTPRAKYLLTALLALLFSASLNVVTDSTVKIYWFYATLLYSVYFLSLQTTTENNGHTAPSRAI